MAREDTWFRGNGCVQHWIFNLSGERNELPEVARAGAGSWDLFNVLGVAPALGRSFRESEDRVGGDAVVMLTWSLFQRRFGGDPSVIGRQILLDAKPHTIIGVLPSWFTYPESQVQLWVPYASVMTQQELERHDETAAQLVKLRYFVGMTNEESAEVLGITPRAAKYCWTHARAWLYREISSHNRGDGK